MTEIRLQGKSGALLTDTDAWYELLDLAEEFGWCPAQRPVLYRADVGLEVAAKDAGELAVALEAVAQHVEIEESAIDATQRSKILRELREVVSFCRAGMFRVC